MKTKCPAQVLLSILSFMPLVQPAEAAPGDLDTTFGGTGISRIGFGFGFDEGRALALQPDGKHIVAGQSADGFMIARFETNGSLDTSFGTGGSVDVSFGEFFFASAVQVQPDGRIVVGGSGIVSSSSDFIIVRLNADGSLDDTFGGGGMVTTDFLNDSADILNALDVSNDKIVAAGHSNGDFAVARYNANGSLDGSFSGDGKVTTLLGVNTFDTANALIQAGGKITVAGNSIHPEVNCFSTPATIPSRADFAVVRYNSNGTLDTTFGGDGIVTTAINHFAKANALTLQISLMVGGPTKIVVAGSASGLSGNCVSGLFSRTSSKIAVARYNPDGSLDTSFDGDGIVITSLSSGSDAATAVGVQTSLGRIIVSGYATPSPGNSDFAVVKYLDNGGLSTGFGTGGAVITPFSERHDLGYAMRLTSSTIVVAGTADNDFALARYSISNGSLDTAFDTDGKVSADFTNSFSQANDTAIQADGKIIVAGIAHRSGTSPNLALLRYNPNGTLDPTFDGDGRATIPVSVNNFSDSAVAIQPTDGKIVSVGFTGTFDFAVTRSNADGSIDTTFGGGDGIVTTPIGAGRDVPKAVAIQRDGAIVVAGYTHLGSSDDFAVVRYLSDGTLDSSFDIDGIVIVPIGAGEDRANAMTIDSLGRIVVVGSVHNGTKRDFGAVRLNPDGSLDTTFSFDGKASAPVGTLDDVGNAVAIQTDGKIILAGSSETTTAINDFAVVRLNEDGSLDSAFGISGRVATPVGAGDEVGNAVVLLPDGRILVAGTSYNGTDSDFAVVRYTPNGSTENTSLIDLLVGENDVAFALALDAVGRAVVAGGSAGLFGVARLQGDSLVKITSIRMVAPGTVRLEGLGTPGMMHTILASPSLRVEFEPIGNSSHAEADGFWEFEESGLSNIPKRFYRAASP